MSVCGCGSQGVLTTLAVMDSAAEGDPDVVFDDTAERYDFIYENIGLNSTVVGDQGLAGSLDLRAEHIRTGPAYVSGSLMMNISPQELEAWLPRILRGAKTGDVHAPGALKPAIDIMIKRDQVTFIYRGQGFVPREHRDQSSGTGTRSDAPDLCRCRRGERCVAGSGATETHGRCSFLACRRLYSHPGKR
jgi:hypothetical protein